MKSTAQIVIVGSGLGGVRVAEELRKSGFGGTLLMIGAEPHVPYDRPPLSKDFLHSAHDATTIELRTRDFFDSQGIDLRLGAAARSLDTTTRTISLSDESSVTYERAVIATGLTATAMPGTDNLQGIFRLRTLDDAIALRQALRSAQSLLVIGAGFIGCEVAATAVELGVHVTLVDTQESALMTSLGRAAGERVTRLHTAHGVDFRGGVGVASFIGGEQFAGAVLTDGSRVDADLAVVGIGAAPSTSWLNGSGLAVENGILCDEWGRTNVPSVWSLGDIAAWAIPNVSRSGQTIHRRVEHWTNTSSQATAVAQSMTGRSGTAASPSEGYVWSDQYGLKIQAVGDVGPHLDAAIPYDDGQKFLAIYTREGRLAGLVGCGMAGRIVRLRQLLGHQYDHHAVRSLLPA